MWKAALTALGCVQLAACATPFERMWQGLASCQFESLYLDSETGQAVNPLLRHYTPDKVEEGFAWYKVHEQLHGLPVTGFIVPASTFEVHVLFVDTPLANARQLSEQAYGSEFADEQAYQQGAAPLLQRDPGNPKRSIIDCSRGESAEEQQDPGFPE